MFYSYILSSHGLEKNREVVSRCLPPSVFMETSSPAMGAHRIFARGANPEASLLFKCISGYSVYLWNTDTCCFISLCRKETDSMSDLAMCKGVHLHLPSGAHVFGVDVLQRPSFFLSSEMRGS